MFAKFRSRKLETNRPLLVFRWDALAAEDDPAAGALLDAEAARAMAPVATGVEREEEDETHLQQALHTQLAGGSRESYTIPTPEAAAVVSDYDALYTPIDPAEIDRRVALALEATQSSLLKLPAEQQEVEAQPGYCADAADAAFAKRLGIPLGDLERAFDALEDAAHRLSVQAAEAEARLRLPDMEGLDAIASHWRKRRAASDAPLLARLRHEDAGKLGADPYVCFRRRELRAARRTRRSEGQVGERLARLRRDIDTAALLLDAIARREALRADALAAEAALFAVYVRADGLPGSSELVPFRTAATSVSAEARRKPEAQRDEGPEDVHPVALEAAALAKARAHALSSDLGMYPPDVASAIAAEYASLLSICGMEDVPIRHDSHSPALADGRPMRIVRTTASRVLVACDSLSSDDDAAPGDWLSGPAFARLLGPRLLSARDVSALQTPLGNYNVHAVQTANTIQRPMSHQAWVASTAPILAAMTAAAAAAGSSGSLLTTATRKRKPSRPAAPPRPAPEPAAAPSPSPRDHAQQGSITVRVKSAPAGESPSASRPPPS